MLDFFWAVKVTRAITNANRAVDRELHKQFWSTRPGPTELA
jgi:uncharacterized protein YecE (DUF72 family)